MDIKKICAALCACVVCLCAAGCSKDSKDSSSVTESKANVSTADNADSAKSEDSKGDESDADSKVLNEQGELITKTAAIFDGDYTLKTTCTEDDGSKQEVVRAKKGGNIYLKVTSDIGTSGFIYVDGAGYDYDNVTGVYHKSDVTELDGVLESIVKQNLPRTYGHINSDEAYEPGVCVVCKPFCDLNGVIIHYISPQDVSFRRYIFLQRLSPRLSSLSQNRRRCRCPRKSCKRP